MYSLICQLFLKFSIKKICTVGVIPFQIKELCPTILKHMSIPDLKEKALWYV